MAFDYNWYNGGYGQGLKQSGRDGNERESTSEYWRGCAAFGVRCDDALGGIWRGYYAVALLEEPAYCRLF